MSDDVGYGKPPKQSQFQKGKSGNPNGRPRGPANKLDGLSGHFVREAQEKIPIQENGRRSRITKAAAIVKQLINKAASGDMRAMTLVLPYLQSVQEEIRQQLLEEMRAVEDLSTEELDMALRGDLAQLFEMWKRNGRKL